VTWNSLTYQIDGGNTTAQLWRQALEAAVGSSQSLGGVVNPLDCVVTVPGTNLIPSIAAGTVLVDGQEVLQQGMYAGYNPGADTSLSVAPTTGTARSDMVVIRVEDPTYTASPWGGLVTNQLMFPRLLANVSSTATVPPAGQSCIPLCRIDMPATASVVLQSYITDLRQMATARSQRTVLQASGAVTAVNWTVGTSATAWPALASWQLPVPVWATGIKLRWQLSNVVYVGGGTNWARGSIYPVLGASVSAPNQAFPSSLVSVNTASTGYEVMVIAGSADVAVSTALRGTTQTLQFAQTTDGTQTGIVQVTEGSVFVVDVELIQRPVTV
jgi:hypothetical protein